MNDKQVLVYGVLQSTNDLRGVFVGHIHFKKLICLRYLLSRTILRNKNMGQSLFKKHSRFQNFDQMFYCGMTRLRNTNLDIFIQC